MLPSWSPESDAADMFGGGGIGGGEVGESGEAGEEMTGSVFTSLTIGGSSSAASVAADGPCQI